MKLETQKDIDAKYWKPTDQHYKNNGFDVDDFA